MMCRTLMQGCVCASQVLLRRVSMLIQMVKGSHGNDGIFIIILQCFDKYFKHQICYLLRGEIDFFF